MDRYTIFENEEEILIEQNSYNEVSPTVRMLQEAQGIVDNYYSICNEIYDAICEVKPIPNNQEISYLIYFINNYKMEQNCFIDNINIRVLAGRKGRKYYGSSFMPNESDITLNNGGKLINITMNIGVSDNDIRTNTSRNEFFKTLAHELHHAFRYYCICNSNNGAKENEKKIRDRYRNAANMIINDNSDKVEKRIVLASYSLNVNEVMSECNKLYEYIRQNEQINSNNFRDYLEDMPLYFRIEQAAKNLGELDDYLFSKDKDKINYVGEVWKKINNVDNISNEKAFLKYRFDLIRKEYFIKRVFYRTLNKAFDDFERKKKIQNIVEMIERRTDFDELNELLKQL